MASETSEQAVITVEFAFDEARELLGILNSFRRVGPIGDGIEKMRVALKAHFATLAEDTHALDAAIAEAQADIHAFDGCEPPEPDDRAPCRKCGAPCSDKEFTDNHGRCDGCCAEEFREENADA